MWNHFTDGGPNTPSPRKSFCLGALWRAEAYAAFTLAEEREAYVLAAVPVEVPPSATPSSSSSEPANPTQKGQGDGAADGSNGGKPSLGLLQAQTPATQWVCGLQQGLEAIEAAVRAMREEVDNMCDMEGTTRSQGTAA